MISRQNAQALPESSPSISTQRELRLGSVFLASVGTRNQQRFLDDLNQEDVAALPYLFEFWALDHQLPPEGDWRSWVVMGGRGAGKTRAGAEWVRSMVEGSMPMDAGRARRVALVGETYDQVRDVMIFGESGIMACTPADRRPKWNGSRRRLEWFNGAVAEAHSASSPEALRGPQFDAAWVDELAKWKQAQEAWDMLQFGLRLGDRPQQVVTTTPRNVAVLKQILENSSTVVTAAPTEANRAYLAESFLEEVRKRYGNTRLGRQELDGVLLEDVDGALWTNKMVENARIEEAPKTSRIVVAVDPAVSSGKNSDACGIVVAGLVEDPRDDQWRAVILEDATVQGASPSGWAQAAVDALRRHGADRIVAEVNQGGALVEEVLRQVSPLTPYKPVHASKNKTTRAEPIAALYEQGRVSHYGPLGDLEDQMLQMSVNGYKGKGSPDRVDALVWALTELMNATSAAPKVRSLG